MSNHGRRAFKIFIFGTLLCALLRGAEPNGLRIYFVDVEAGAATLIVNQAGESLLADAGNATPDDRDAKRIYQATQQLGLKKIDYLLITHFDSDHVGGAPALAGMIPIGKFLDHGDSIETQTAQAAERWKAYLSVATGRRVSLKPGTEYRGRAANPGSFLKRAGVIESCEGGKGEQNTLRASRAEGTRPDREWP